MPGSPIYSLKKFFALKNASSAVARHPLRDDRLHGDQREGVGTAAAVQAVFLDQGILHFALFDLGRTRDDDRQRHWQRRTAAVGGDGENPLIVFGNYIFDSLTQDYFRVEGGKLQKAYRPPAAPSPPRRISAILRSCRSLTSP